MGTSAKAVINKFDIIINQSPPDDDQIQDNPFRCIKKKFVTKIITTSSWNEFDRYIDNHCILLKSDTTIDYVVHGMTIAFVKE